MNARLRQQIELDKGRNQIVLRGDGTAWLPDEQALLVADLHLGKDASFRAAGIAVPTGINRQTLLQLSQSIIATRPKSLYLLGDLIHNRDSMTAAVNDQFAAWRRQHADLPVTLVLGNHDRHVDRFPDDWNLSISESIQLDDWTLVHQTSTESTAHGHTQIGGHWHPVVRLGRSLDRTYLRCFVVDPGQITLPAVGPFKGGTLQKSRIDRQIFPICDNQIWCVETSAPSSDA